MKRSTLLVASLLALATPALAADTPPAPAPITARLQSAVARTAYEEFVADVLAVAEKQAAAFTALDKNVTNLTADKVREQMAFLETLAATRAQISQGRRGILGCTQLSREESELLLGELAAVKARWDKLLGEEVPARKAALTRQLEIAAVAVMAPPAPVAAPTMRTPTEVLTAASRRLRPTGIAAINGEYHLMLDGQRMKAGQTIKVKLDREHTVTLAAVSKNSYTLALDGETLVVPME